MDPDKTWHEEHEHVSTFGERLADSIARVGGSWGFIIAFMLFLVFWALINTVVFVSHAFDPYPFIFLNLVLSMLAAIQAPVIMMSQNRQAARDRVQADHDYQTNLAAKAEIEALQRHLHAIEDQKLDTIRADIEAIKAHLVI